jgi:hypothetical protein
LKPAQANSSWDPILKIPITKRAGRVGSRWRPWVQVPVPKKKKKKKKKTKLVRECFQQHYSQ